MMQYPLITEYVRAISDSKNNLDQLSNLRPVLDDHNEPFRSSGAFAVVFKMIDEETGELYALKCFTEEQSNRAKAYQLIAKELENVDSIYLTHVQYFENELFVDSSCTDETEFPVLLMEWVEGQTMEKFVEDNYKDEQLMKILFNRFCMLASWLSARPFAHGDIKPDNIIVREDGNLTLVDYDGMFVPAMHGWHSPTLGTKDFTHPLRSADDFDKSIDDFALVSIALSLKAISLDYTLLDKYGAPDRLLFSAEDYRLPSKSSVMTKINSLLYDSEICRLYGKFLVVLSSKSITYSKEMDEEYNGMRNGDNEKQGFGVLKKIDGSCYAGEWKLDMKTGFGIELGYSREKYAGQWRSNVQNGIGIHLEEDGIIYSGEWKNGKKNGLGIVYLPNGEKLISQFIDNKLVGENAIWILKDNSILQGHMSIDGPCGFCKHYFSDGTYKEEEWFNGKKIIK